ncbi:hypothetical protein [Rarobacter incanus]|uniref:Uncharacterized protein n=1 Tax=Rarobacter incanus TaxID=153494 RepID=A0A542SPC4_9MICO|nr:hypothetical protein [Rarobacter incanus]TQK76418.1 hypothetical protein FB389_1089 [Rarobacter incanus]
MSEPTNRNPDYVELVAASASLADAYAADEDDPWATSPFGWILKLPSRTKGAVGEKLISKWAESQGFPVKRSPNSEADRIINGHRIEIKMSTLWSTGDFKFQQIREQEYDYCLCLGLMPQDARAWLLPKDLLRQYVIGHTPQHTGAGGSDTFWLGFPADRPPAWMAEYGDTLEDVADAFRKMGRGSHG